MSFWDYKYGGITVRDRWDCMIGKHAGPIEWVVRGAIIAFALRTMTAYGEHIYLPPVAWVGFVLLIYWT